MTLGMDPQVAAGLAAIAAARGKVTPPPAGDWQTRRANAEAGLPLLLGTGLGNEPDRAVVVATDHEIPVPDGARIAARWYAPQSAEPGGARPAVLYLHGGGMIFGGGGLYERPVAEWVRDTGVPFLSVDYRLAPEHPGSGPSEDCYAALCWFADRATDFGVDPARIAVMGDSAGGGLAAATSLLARDRNGPAVAKQILLYPMLDDRTVEPDPRRHGLLTWSWDDNVTGWRALLGDAAGTDEVSPYAAPARAQELHDLPATYLDVGDLDIFCAEGLRFAAGLCAAAVQVEVHVHPGAPHGFEVYAPASDLARRARADRVRAVTSF